MASDPAPPSLDRTASNPQRSGGAQVAGLVDELREALRGSERRFDAVVGSLADAVTIRDREHRFLYANRAALAHLGFESWEQLRETAPAAIMSDYYVCDEHGNELAMADIPSVRILRGEAAGPLLIQTIHRDSGVRRWNLLKSAPLLDEHGEVEATITIIEEVTERKRAELRGAFLARGERRARLLARLRADTPQRRTTRGARTSRTGALWTCSTRTATAARSRWRTSTPRA